jgi:general secretion pathway protein G
MRRPGARITASGFTLVELLVTVVIVSILALGAVPFLELASQRARESELRTALRQIRTAIDAYKKAVDDGQVRRKADEAGYPPSLEILADGVDNARPEGPRRLVFLRRVPRDPMFPDRSVPAARTWGLRSYESTHDRPAEGRDVFDVYSRAEGTGLNGVRYREW